MKTETMNLQTSRGNTTAYVARPETDTAAAVVLIHEWWGINDHIRDIADVSPVRVTFVLRRTSFEERLPAPPKRLRS